MILKENIFPIKDQYILYFFTNIPMLKQEYDQKLLVPHINITQINHWNVKLLLLKCKYCINKQLNTKYKYL